MSPTHISSGCSPSGSSGSDSKPVSRTENWELQLKEAARHHGGECVGLAIGIRAVDIATRELGISGDTRALRVRVGTKKCLGDAFKVLLRLEKRQLEYTNSSDDLITVRNGTDAVELHLNPKKLMEASQVFEESEENLFPIIKRLMANRPVG